MIIPILHVLNCNQNTLSKKEILFYGETFFYKTVGRT